MYPPIEDVLPYEVKVCRFRVMNIHCAASPSYLFPFTINALSLPSHLLLFSYLSHLSSIFICFHLPKYPCHYLPNSSPSPSSSPRIFSPVIILLFSYIPPSSSPSSPSLQSSHFLSRLSRLSFRFDQPPLS